MEMLIPLIEKILTESNPVRIAESMGLLGIIWWKLKPHLKKIEEELAKINGNMKNGFEAGEIRFAKIETGLTKIETRVGKLETQGE